MAAPIETKIWTWQEALALPDGERYEVVNGELRERKMSSLSSKIAMLISRYLWPWIDAGHPGSVTGSDGGFAIFPWTAGDVRMPDLAYISYARIAVFPERGWVDQPPELAVEVVSPTDLASDVDEKANDYIRAGVDLVWVVFPRTRLVHVYRRSGSRDILGPDDVLSGEEAMPGFSVRVRDIFPSDTP